MQLKKTSLRALQFVAWFSIFVIFIVYGEQDARSLGRTIGRIMKALFPFIIVFFVLFPLLWSKKKYILFAIGISILTFFYVTKMRSGFAIEEDFFTKLITCIIMCTAAIILRLIRDWFDNQDFQNKLKIENLNSELRILKYQNSPHFIFNVLNSIDALIHIKPAKASETISKMAVMMRYMSGLYHQDRVPLNKELDYIKDFIDLHTMRLPKEALVHFECEGDTTDIEVEPMLFMPFIENIFKHGRFEKNDEALIAFKLDEKKLEFRCENVICNNDLSENEKSGIGLEILRKRLDLLYKNTYKLKVDTKEKRYKVKLNIPLEKN